MIEFEVLANNEFIEVMKSINYITYKKYDYQAKTSIKYMNLISSFDIEVSSFYDKDRNKVGLPYMWVFAIDKYITYGREFSDFILLLDNLQYIFTSRLVIYVHNLGYEFQFLRTYLNWQYVFAREQRKPFKAINNTIFEFRDSLILSGYRLELVAKNLVNSRLKKLIGNLDYEKIRSPKTPLTKEELDYCIYDVMIVQEYIREQLDIYKKIIKIPLTNTGRVRLYCKKHCLEKNKKYRDLMQELTLNVDEYDFLKSSFSGGYTHANVLEVNKVHANVSSYDITSSYPYVLLTELYPMSKGEKIKIKSYEHLKVLEKNYCIVLNCKFYELVQKENVYDSYLSTSKCLLEGAAENNGRIMSAFFCATICTNIDFEIIEKCYNFTKVEFGTAYIYKKDYLPKKFQECILDFYVDKTTLKGVRDQESEYLLKKGMLNSTYGMTVTDISNDIVDYIDEWTKSEADVECDIDKYNKDKKRFLFYPWGVFCTAYARRNLWNAILAVGADYIYSDTDSVKFIRNHDEYFKLANEKVHEKIKIASEINKIDISRYQPLNKIIGVWDYEGIYNELKTLGAKRYLVRKGDEYKITCSGIHKEKVSEYLTAEIEKPFDFFNHKMHIDKEHSGRNIVSYIDDRRQGSVIDYLGAEYRYDIPTGIHMEKSDYNLEIGEKYLTLLNTLLYN